VTIVVLGSVNMDLVATAASLPAPGQTVLGHRFAMIPGGKGGNQAVAVARAGGRAALIGAVGSDDFGLRLRAELDANGVGTSLLRTVPGASGVALISVDDAGENQIVVAPGANGSVAVLTAADRAAIASAEMLICQLEVPLDVVVEAAVVASGAGTPVILNAAPARALPVDLLDAISVLVVNEGEAATVIDAPGIEPAELVDTLLTKVRSAIVTLGAAGARWGDSEGRRLAVAAPAVAAVDTTGAGDAFVGAFAVASCAGRSMRDALRWACAAGAACATVAGAASSLPMRAAIDALLASSSIDGVPTGNHEQ
jgi:ribokinase